MLYLSARDKNSELIQISLKIFKKSLQERKRFVSLQSQNGRGPRVASVLQRKFIEKTEGSTSKYREKRKNRERWFLKRSEASGASWKNRIIYKEEFDPGSGWTLAAGLTHASRGAARGSNTLAATGGRVRNAWATCPYPGDNHWKRCLISHNNNERMLNVWKIRQIRIGSRDIS